MINRLRVSSTVLTDFNVGSNIRVLLEAVSQEIDELYQQMISALQAAIAQATYLSFGFTPLPATTAQGSITVTITVQTFQVSIAPGTVFTPANGGSIVYTSTALVLMEPGLTSIAVPVVASSPGSAGNLVAGSTFSVNAAPYGFVSATNVGAITGGLDAETPQAQFIRFQAFIVSLARSTLAGVRYGALSVYLTDQYGNVTERVTAAVPVEPYVTNDTLPAWQFYLYIYNGVGAAPGASGALIAAVQAAINGGYDANNNPIDGYKAAGTVCIVQAATLNTLAITAALVLTSGTITSTTIAAVEAAWANYIATLNIGQGVYLAQLTALAMAVPGVVDISFSVPTADVAGAVGTQVIGGAFSVTATGGTDT